jgi:hypothetical protein
MVLALAAGTLVATVGSTGCYARPYYGPYYGRAYYGRPVYRGYHGWYGRPVVRGPAVIIH